MRHSIDDPQARLEHARWHLEQLATEVHAFLAAQPYEWTTERDLATGDYVYRARIHQRPPVSLVPWSATSFTSSAPPSSSRADHGAYSQCPHAPQKSLRRMRQEER